VRSVHVALNACFLDPAVSGGPETYLRGLVPALASECPTARLTVLTTRRGAAGLRAAGWQDFASVVELPFDDGQRVRRLAAEVVGVPYWVRKHRPALLHNLASIGPGRDVAVRQVLTLHDLTFLRLATFSRATTFAMSRLSLGTARHATRIITATHASSRDLIDIGGLDPSIVDVVPHGRKEIKPVSASFIERVRFAHRLDDRRVVICVAAKRPHKNQAVLVRAMDILPRDVVLVLVGHPEAYDAELRALATAARVDDRIRFLDYVKEDELEALWALADVAAFPSRGEGFGLPVIEAMDRGLPVACSAIPVLQEVSGGLAFEFRPDDPDDAAQQILAALADDSNANRRRAYASQFTWTRAAELTWESYERALTPPLGSGTRSSAPIG
jgi:glycosyltransferase involved in cell wall biosynthesis